jgi:hypothetical protein
MRGVPPGLVLLRPDRYAAGFLPANQLKESIGNIDTLIARTWQ